jgi:hypothetical protein
MIREDFVRIVLVGQLPVELIKKRVDGEAEETVRKRQPLGAAARKHP